MLAINIKNVEELVFYNKNLRSQLADFHGLFLQWDQYVLKNNRVSQKKCLLDFLASVNETHIQVLKDYFNKEVKVDNVDYHIVKCNKFPISGAEGELCGMAGYENFAITRDTNHLYILFWR